MRNLREHWEGVLLPGGYLLQQRWSGSQAGEFFETTLSTGARALVKLVPEAGVDAASRLALWERTRSLQHPNLNRLLECGRAELGAETVLYAVFEFPDDTLAAAIARSPLTDDEAGEVLTAVLEGLKHLEGQGLAHPALDPPHVLGVDDKIQLATDELREAAPGESFAPQLRNFWQKIAPGTPQQKEALLARALGVPPEPAAAPPPAALPPTPQRPTSQPATPKPASPAAPVASRAPASPPGKVPSQGNGRTAAPSLPPPHRRTELPPTRPLPPAAQERRGFPKWVLGAAAAVVLVILGLSLRHSPETPVAPATAAPASSAASVPKSAPAPARVETPAPPPAEPKGSPFADTRKPVSKVSASEPAASKPLPSSSTAPSQPGTAPKTRWRVIAYTYLSHDAAAKKVAQVNEGHPGLDASVFEPKNKPGYFLVALGGFMTRNEALTLQNTARAQGLPHDVYIHNFEE